MSSAKSYSRWLTYHKCPAKYDFIYNKGYKGEQREPSPALVRGNEIHKSCENFMGGLSEFLHPEIHENYGQFFHSIRETYEVFPEEEFALTSKWTKTYFNAANCMVRGYLDCKIKTPTDQPLLIHEYKSGKIYDEHQFQRDLYGIVGLLIEPEYDSCTVQTIYLDKQKFHEDTYHRDDLPQKRFIWFNRFREMDNDEVYITKPQFACRWCECSKENGGPCPF